MSRETSSIQARMAQMQAGGGGRIYTAMVVVSFLLVVAALILVWAWQAAEYDSVLMFATGGK